MTIPPEEIKPTKMSGRTLILIAVGATVIALLIVVGAMVNRPFDAKRKTAGAATPTPKKAVCDKSASMQAQRRDGIDEMIHKYRVFSKVEKPGDVVHVWVTPSFYETKYDSKKTLMELVYCYYYDDDQSIIRIFDDANGKQVGKYSVMLGLDLD